MINPNQKTADPNGGNTIPQRPAQAGGIRVPPLRHRSLQPTPEAAKSPRARLRRKLRLLNAARRRAADAITRAIPPAPDPLAP